jgi:hypothetical protein
LVQLQWGKRAAHIGHKVGNAHWQIPVVLGHKNFAGMPLQHQRFAGSMLALQTECGSAQYPLGHQSAATPLEL